MSVALLALTALPAASADDPLLARLVGEWVGRGTSSASPTAKREPVYCKMTNRLVNDGTTLEQKGRCAVASNSGAVRGAIAARGGGRFSGSLDSFSTVGPAKLAGRGSDGRIELNAEFVDRRTRRATKAIISLDLSGDGKYRLISNQLAPDGKSRFVASDIVFIRQ